MENFSADEPFIVKNSVGILLFMIIASAAMFVSCPAYSSTLLSYILFSGATCTGCIIALVYRKRLITIDNRGIFSNDFMVTD